MAQGMMAHLTTPAFLVDRAGTLIFFNEAAGRLLGQSYEEAAPMTAEVWASRPDVTQASASLMTMKVKGKSRLEAIEILNAFHNLVTKETSDAPKLLGDLRLLQGVRKFPQRVKCAMLAWRALEEALRQNAGESTVSTESDSDSLEPHQALSS